MPYEIVREKTKWIVRNTETGRVLGKHTSKAKARAQIRAVGARHGKKKSALTKN